MGHRLIQANGQYELAHQMPLTAQHLKKVWTAEVLVWAWAAANLGLGRLGQSEKPDITCASTRSKKTDALPEVWNNLGVVLMEKRQNCLEAVSRSSKRAYALDNGESDAIRDNLTLGTRKIRKFCYRRDLENEANYTLVRRGAAGIS